jgi:RNA polymerase sigma factor for flagellar operon FliA
VARLQDPPEVLARFNDTLELVEIVARQVSRAVGTSIELADLLSFGREGLLDAARRYDPERGVPFRAYANFRVRGAIIDGVRVMGRLPRRAHERLRGLEAASRTSEGVLEDVHAQKAPGLGPAHADQSLSEHLAAMATAMAMGLMAEHGRGEEGELVGIVAVDPESQTAEAELRAIVRSAIGDLPEQESELVRRHYLEGERFDLVAKDLGLSKSWASRLHTRAIGRLTKRLRGQVA